jgi:DNA-binding MarR family transcriptional regulator
MSPSAAFTLANQHGVSPRGLQILLFCIEDAPCRPCDIAAHTSTTAANITGALDRLQHSGWITRAASPRDRRSRPVVPTPKAYEIFTPCLTP